MGQNIDQPQTGVKPMSFLREFAKDNAANTIAISAASLVPLMAMVGGGVDASRYYMAETRLQAACDAGALAARRAMSDQDFEDEHEEIGNNFFDHNYPENTFGLVDLDREYAADNEGIVTGTATGKMPTTIMGAFGYEQFDIKVDCSADINISNTDIMFVIDVTGSMNCAPDNPGGGNCGNSPDTGAKLYGLQDAMMTFYDTVDSSTSASAQVRYGIVPYSSNVNAGAALMDENPDWLAKSHTYQSREGELVVGDWEETGRNYNRTSGASNWQFQETQTYTFYYNSVNQCQNKYNQLRYFDEYHSSDEGSWTLASQSNGNPQTTIYTGTVTFEYYGSNNSSYYNSSSNECYLAVDFWLYDASANIIITEEREETFEWIYRPVTYDLTTLYDDNEIELPTGWNLANETVTWDGCIEEANTVAQATFDPVPAGANDLDINLVPSNADEYWKPVLRNAVWKREDSGGNTLSELRQTSNENRPSYSCNTPARRLTDMSRTDLQTFVDSLEARGSTYHDIGMIWGARFISPNGIFASDNETAPNGDAIARHIVFMTDGILSTNGETYGMYGVEWWDRRITTDGSNGQASSRHAERFQAACRAARRENISVWVVAFGTALSQNLIDCATPGRAFVADDSAQLEARFKEIAQQIAALRLTQ